MRRDLQRKSLRLSGTNILSVPSGVWQPEFGRLFLPNRPKLYTAVLWSYNPAFIQDFYGAGTMEQIYGWEIALLPKYQPIVTYWQTEFCWELWLYLSWKAGSLYQSVRSKGERGHSDLLKRVEKWKKYIFFLILHFIKFFITRKQLESLL